MTFEVEVSQSQAPGVYLKMVEHAGLGKVRGAFTVLSSEEARSLASRLNFAAFQYDMKGHLTNE